MIVIVMMRTITLLFRLRTVEVAAAMVEGTQATVVVVMAAVAGMVLLLRLRRLPTTATRNLSMKRSKTTMRLLRRLRIPMPAVVSLRICMRYVGGCVTGRRNCECRCGCCSPLA
jgi:hypothetical protein